MADIAKRTDATHIATATGADIAAPLNGAAALTNGAIKSDAAIAGTKISPNFGVQNITTQSNIVASGTITSGDTATNGGFSIYGANSNLLTIFASPTTDTFDLTLPPNVGTNGQFLQTDGAGNTSWGTTGTVTNTSGNLTASALMVGNGTADSKVLSSLGTTTTVLHGNAAGLPTWGAVSLSADVTGTLPAAKLPSGMMVNFQKTEIVSTAELKTTSSAGVSTGLTVTITPTVGTVRITGYTECGGPGMQPSSFMYVSLKRTIGATTTDLGIIGGSLGNYQGFSAMAYEAFDSPGTGSPVTYELFFASSNNSTAVYWVYYQFANIRNRITAQEITP